MAIFGPKQRSVDQTWWINIFWRKYLIWDPCLYLWWAPGGAVCGGPCVSQNQTCLSGSLCGLTSSLLSKPSVLQLIVSAVRLWNTKDSFVTWWPADLLYRLLQRTYWLVPLWTGWLAGCLWGCHLSPYIHVCAAGVFLEIMSVWGLAEAPHHSALWSETLFCWCWAGQRHWAVTQTANMRRKQTDGVQCGVQQSVDCHLVADSTTWQAGCRRSWKWLTVFMFLNVYCISSAADSATELLSYNTVSPHLASSS